ncbi:hypothetical protein HELRODRAFT_189234 [Helobdella robusta]|uniref:Aminopeptidase n=1 Tax=Helobdella robusta TaxID=6412 RepID=T1FQU4_HELRO|nr:hypothetical protein HELRODRAFT_189234 [Helobdella robusta]ESN96433.1 hypothetical protein HELRODRAFT_189234 [Helobdella robusta]
MSNMIGRTAQLVSLGLLFLSTVPTIFCQEHEGRLPRTFLPTHYNLYLEPHLELDKPPFPLIGQVKIYFTCIEKTNNLTLNALGLELGIANITLKQLTISQNHSVPRINVLIINDYKQIIRMIVDREFQAGFQYTITIDYKANLTENGYGMYAARYLDKNGRTKYLAATQLEPIGARRMFPGFDEVDMKATFDVIVSRRMSHTSLSNAPIVGTYAGAEGWLNDVYERSPLMSCYLLAVVVGDLHYMESKVDAGTKYKVRTYSTERFVPYIYHPNKYFTFPIQKWLEEETNIPYAQKKMVPRPMIIADPLPDHITLSTFGGAMENWGLITYADNILPVSNATSTASGYYTSAFVVAHELSHMWYGNLVTCEWWTHLWLQEAMASYYNFYPLDALGWRGAEFHQLNGVVPYMELDQTNRSTPVRIVIKSPQEASQAFASSTYDKGGCMIRMIGQILTKPVLKLALTRYLKKYQYSVANSDQFLQVFTDQAKDSGITYPDGSAINFKTLMDPWLDQKGFPILKVVDNNDGTATVTQQRYFNPSNQSDSVVSPYGYKWDVPIQVLHSNSSTDWLKTPNYWLRRTDKEIKIKIPKNSWYIINPNQKFYYKVFYDKKQRSLMSQNLMSVPVETTANIIDDTFGLSRNAYYGATDAYDNTLSIGSDPSYNVWSLTLRHVYDLEPFYRKETWFAKHTTYFAKHADALLKRIGYEFAVGEPISHTYLRRDGISAACWFKSSTCLQYIRAKYQEYKKNPSLNSVNANLLPTTLCDGVAQGTTADWNMMASEYGKRKNSPIMEERQSLLYARTCTPRENELQQIFNELLKSNGTFFNTADLGYASIYLAGTPYGATKYWEYLDKNWKTFPNHLNKLSIMSVITESWYTVQQVNQLAAFIARQDMTSHERLMMNTYLMRTEQNYNFYKNNIVELGNWFNKQPFSDEVDLKMTSLEPIRMSDFKMWTTIGQSRIGKFFESKTRHIETESVMPERIMFRKENQI